MKWVLALAVFVGAWAAFAAEEPAGFVVDHLCLYQDPDAVALRVPDAHELSAYLKQIQKICEEAFAAEKKPQTLDVVVMIKPGRRSRVWVISSQRKNDDKIITELRRRLEAAEPTDVLIGPVVVALSGNIAGGARKQPGAEDEEPPVPQEWRELLKGIKGGVKLDDELFAKVWPDEPGETDAIKPPKGYVVQKLAGLGGTMLKPEGWFFRERLVKSTLVYQMAKEDLNKGEGFITGFTINVVPKVLTQNGEKASQTARDYLEEYEKKAKVVSRDEPRRDGRFQRLGVVFDEKLKLMGKDVDCRVGVTTYASDDLDLLVVMIFGCPREEWEGNQKMYATICAQIRLMDLRKKK